MEVIITIIPIFAIIILGWTARKRGFITQEFLEPANRLVYYLSLPALVFNAIAKASFHEQFDATVLGLALLATTSIYLAAGLIVRVFKIVPSQAGAFVQSAGHGNIGYIGLPIALYYLGPDGLAKTGIICGFMMILQNLLSVTALQFCDTTDRQFGGLKTLIGKLLGNPVILSAMTGILVSGLTLPIPRVIGRCLDILGGLAPPMALLLIGASLSTKLVHSYLRPTLGAVFCKLVLLPACGLILFTICGITANDYLPALILLCAPTATLAYVMAREMHGDSDFAVSTISTSTLFSSLSFLGWLLLVNSLSSP